MTGKSEYLMSDSAKTPFHPDHKNWKQAVGDPNLV